MNRSESRYFATAARMDEAFLTLLAKKDFEYITIKEICEVAGVNRSTFYLHYETMSDLLSESVGRMNKQFLASMEKDSDAFSTKRYGVLQQDRPYIMAFYIRGLMAIISEWLKNDCTDSITYVTGVIQQCVKMPQSETTNAV